MEAELQTYLDQLAYVNLQLETEPENEELKTLKTELNEIIDLTKAAIGHTSGGSSSSKAAPDTKGKGKSKDANWQDNGQYKAGMDCMAKYKDGKWLVLTLPISLSTPVAWSPADPLMQVSSTYKRSRWIPRFTPIHHHLQGLLIIDQRTHLATPSTRPKRAYP